MKKNFKEAAEHLHEAALAIEKVVEEMDYRLVKEKNIYIQLDILYAKDEAEEKLKEIIALQELMNHYAE